MSKGGLWLEWQPAQVRANTSPAERDRALAELLIELRIEFLGRHAAGDVEVFRAGRQEEVDDVLKPILDRAEARAIAPALADVERRLAVIALRRIDRAQIGNVVEPALLGAGADVEVDALDGLSRADIVFAAFENVLDRLDALAALPAFSGLLGSHQHVACGPSGHWDALRHLRMRWS